MGTDIYLEWDGMTEEEKKAQYTGFSIDAGRVGYLRASIGMVRENQVLREVFPNEYWDSEDSLPYDFKANYERVQEVGAKYLASILFDLPLADENSEAMNYAKYGETINSLLCAIFNGGYQSGEYKVDMSRKLGIRYAVMWLNSLFDFFDLGYKKQEEGLNPRVYISW